MKDFLKFTLATVTGLILTGIIFIFLGVISILSIASSAETETIVKKNSVMVLNLNGTLVERTQEDFNSMITQLTGDGTNSYGLDDILSSIKKAKENENIKGIYIKAYTLATSYASLEAIRPAFLDFK